jgi:hypothetical protein
VVHESDEDSGDIYGSYIDASSGSALGSPFKVNLATGLEESKPDVAYSSIDDRFVVVWEQLNADDSTDILAVMLHGEYQVSGVQHPAGAQLATLNTIYSENARPAIAYNSDDDYMMVVYQSNEPANLTRIRGRMMRLSFNGYEFILFGSSDFEVWDETGGGSIRHPDIAWGGESDTFLVSYEMATSGSSQHIMASYFKDTFQDGSDQSVDGSSHTISEPISATLDIHDSPAVAYDPELEMYAVVYRSMADETNFLYQVTGMFLKGYVLSPGGPWVNGSYAVIQPLISPPSDTNLFVDIAYSGVPGLMQVCYSQSFPIFGEDYYYVYQRDYTFNLESASVSAALPIRTSPIKIIQPAKIASAGYGRGICVWTEEYSASDWDVYGQRFRFVPPYKVMLPALFK